MFLLSASSFNLSPAEACKIYMMGRGCCEETNAGKVAARIMGDAVADVAAKKKTANYSSPKIGR